MDLATVKCDTRHWSDGPSNCQVWHKTLKWWTQQLSSVTQDTEAMDPATIKLSVTQDTEVMDLATVKCDTRHWSDGPSNCQVWHKTLKWWTQQLSSVTKRTIPSQYPGALPNTYYYSVRWCPHWKKQSFYRGFCIFWCQDLNNKLVTELFQNE